MSTAQTSKIAGDLPKPLISVVVSTCNRSKDLPRLFEALDHQSASGRIPWELIIVDNRSTDDTAQVIRDLAGRAGFPVVYVFEGRQGKSYGLNAGIEAARGAIIALTDDDGVPAPDWLERLQAHFEAHADVVCVGGRVELYDPADAPMTILLSREPRIVDISNFSAFDIPVIGCNMAIRAQPLREVGPYDVSIGPGTRAGSGEDLDMLYRLVSAEHRVRYDPTVLVYHNHGRRSAEQVAHVWTSYLIGRGAFYCKHAMKSDRTVLRWAYWELRWLLKDCFRSGLITSAARVRLRDFSLISIGVLRYLRHGGRETGPVARTKDE